MGDLNEQFYSSLKIRSPFQSKFRYWHSIFSLMFSYAINKRKRDAKMGEFASSNISIDMLRSYLTVASRNLYQHKYFSILNAFGLAVGMSVSLLLIALVTYVKTYDTFHKNRDHIYTIVSERTEGVEQLSGRLHPLCWPKNYNNTLMCAKCYV